MTLAQTKIVPEVMEALIENLKKHVFKDKVELCVAVREEHAASKDDTGEHGLHWHLLIDFGEGQKNRRRVDYEKINEAVRRYHKDCSTHIDPAAKGTYESIMTDILEYLLKQITVLEMKKLRSFGRFLTPEQFEAHRKDNYVGDWEQAFANFLNRGSVQAIPQMKGNALLGYTIEKMYKEGKTFRELFDVEEFDWETKGKLGRTLKVANEVLFELNKQKNQEMKMIELPPCPIFPQWAPTAHADDLLEHHKKVHLYIYGEPNTGKTSFVFKWAEHYNLKVCKAPMGSTMKFDEERFKNADVILIDDLMPVLGANGKKDANAFDYTTILNWSNGEFIVGVYKKNISTKRKIIIITSNFPPEETLPMDNMTCERQLRARFFFWHVKAVDRKFDPLEGNIVRHFLKAIEQEKELGVLTVPESPPAEIPESPKRVRPDEIEEIESSDNDVPGCHGQEDIIEVDNPKLRLLDETEAMKYAMIDFMFATGMPCAEFKTLDKEVQQTAIENARGKTLLDYEEIKERVRQQLLVKENERRANDGMSQLY